MLDAHFLVFLMVANIDAGAGFLRVYPWFGRYNEKEPGDGGSFSGFF
jgi:hypothetical protein